MFFTLPFASPVSTRLEKKKTPYDLIWEDGEILRGKVGKLFHFNAIFMNFIKWSFSTKAKLISIFCVVGILFAWICR